MQKVIKCVFIIIGTIIGAGFASGQEIASFFNRFAYGGKIGLALACLMFWFEMIIVLNIITKYKDFDQLVWKNGCIRYVQQIFLTISFCIMISGIGAFFKEQFAIYSWVGALVGSTVCFIVFSYRYKGLELINTVLVPLIIIGMLLIGFGKYDVNALDTIKYKVQYHFTDSFFISAILYVGYNSLILFPILMTFKTNNLSKRQNFFIATVSFLILFTVGMSVLNAIDVYYPKILVFEIPTLKLASMMGKVAKLLYGGIILFSIFTTAISSGFSFLEIDSRKYTIRNILLCSIAFLVSNIGFSDLINTLFPIFGYIGLLNIAIIFLKYMIYYKKQR